MEGAALVVAEESADTISQALKEAGEAVYRLGRVTECPDPGQRVNYINS